MDQPNHVVKLWTHIPDVASIVYDPVLNPSSSSMVELQPKEQHFMDKARGLKSNVDSAILSLPNSYRILQLDHCPSNFF